MVGKLPTPKNVNLPLVRPFLISRGSQNQCPQKNWKTKWKMHKSRTIISGAKATPDDDSQLRDVRTRDCADHLCAIFRDTAFLGFRAYHVACDVYKKEQRDRALRAELDEMGRLERRRREENAVIRDNANGETVDVCEPLQVSVCN
jgi:hypothetical protein